MTAQVDADSHTFVGRMVMHCSTCNRDFLVGFPKDYTNTCPYCRAFLTVWTCNRCGHVWSPKDIRLTERRVCPSCKSPYWNREKLR